MFLRLTSQINLVLESLSLSLPLGGNENLQYPTEHPKSNPFSLHPLLSTLVQGTVISCLHYCKTFLTDLPGSSLGLLESAFHTRARICFMKAPLHTQHLHLKRRLALCYPPGGGGRCTQGMCFQESQHSNLQSEGRTASPRLQRVRALGLPK